MLLRLAPVENKEIDFGGLNESSNFLKILANSSAAFKAYAASEEALGHGKLEPRYREQIALAVAEINACGYCLRVHSAAGRELGLTEQEIELARQARALDAKAEAMLRFTQAIVLQRGKISDDDFSAVVKAGFSCNEVVEIVANIALNIFSNFLNLMARTETELPLKEPNITLAISHG